VAGGNEGVVVHCEGAARRAFGTAVSRCRRAGRRRRRIRRRRRRGRI